MSEARSSLMSQEQLGTSFAMKPCAPNLSATRAEHQPPPPDGIHSRTNEAKMALEFSSVIDAMCEDIGKRIESGSAVTGLKTGFPELDDMTEGLKPGELIVLGARPVMGKTNLALSVAFNIARNGRTVVIFSAQLKNTWVAMRLATFDSGIEARRLAKGHMSPAEWAALQEKLRDLSALPLLIDDTESMDADHIAQQIGLLEQDYSVGLVVVDGLQELLPSRHLNHKELHHETTAALNLLKRVALKSDIPILVTSQLGHSADKRRGHRPILADLRHFQHIQHCLDSVWLLYRESYYDHTTDDKNLLEIILVTQRNRITGSIWLDSDPCSGKFQSLQEMFPALDKPR